MSLQRFGPHYQYAVIQAIKNLANKAGRKWLVSGITSMNQISQTDNFVIELVDGVRLSGKGASKMAAATDFLYLYNEFRISRCLFPS